LKSPIEIDPPSAQANGRSAIACNPLHRI
jgi:hypothetical protein